eukprot:CAMPEP_0113882288 /NCGR_PEP_ID=MMETSP0780_2-20120614/8868_1 /TAXON_ID=652834 /ORGANISM="Palpitomonas bilix" /LENGTH=339 /DNA_ID=CAMNT_0000869279 /DNA_START=55 /DNA_END=1074 /DNA_ORIENTATION=- /assembly_acc=CAM_ASM_000599
MNVNFTPDVAAAIADVRSDASDTNWLVLEYQDKKTLKVEKTGSDGLAGILAEFADEKVLYAFLRTFSGDRESKRVKFVFIVWIGDSAGGLTKARVTTHKGDVAKTIGHVHCDFQVSDKDDLTEDIVTKRLKAVGGADYDLGSNSVGYESQADKIKKSAAEAYKSREKEGNVGGVVYETAALPKSTPCDLSGRRMVAPPTEAMSNTNLSGNLDVKKWEAEEGKKEEQAAPAPAEAEKKEEEAAPAEEEKKEEAAAPAPAEEEKEEEAAPAEEEKKEEEEAVPAPAEEEKKEEEAAPAEEKKEEEAAPAEEEKKEEEEEAAPAEEKKEEEAAPAEEEKKEE